MKPLPSLKGELLHQLLLHLPPPPPWGGALAQRGVIWRLLGFNKELNRVLQLESLWREKCEREFPLLHDKSLITSYRLYYLIRSDHLVAKMWESRKKIPVGRVSWYRLCEDDIETKYHLFLSGGNLYQRQVEDHLHPSGWGKLILSGIDKITELSQDWYQIESDTTYHYLHFVDADTVNSFAHLLGDNYDQSLIANFNLTDDVNYDLYFFLLSDGGLYRSEEKMATKIKDEVVQIIGRHNDRLAIL